MKCDRLEHPLSVVYFHCTCMYVIFNNSKFLRNAKENAFNQSFNPLPLWIAMSDCLPCVHINYHNQINITPGGMFDHVMSQTSLSSKSLKSVAHVLRVYMLLPVIVLRYFNAIILEKTRLLEV